MCVTNLAVLDFHPRTRAMRLASTHPGVEVDQVVDATGFDLEVADDVATTPAPTLRQRRLLRDVVDPTGMRHREFP